jgi:Spy/CpxP family protein refolding chaperone
MVHPRIIELSRRPRTFAVSLGTGCAPAAQAWHDIPWSGPSCAPEGSAGGFGVKRPLRFLAFKLQLTEQQMAELAVILDELKTERAQAAVDDRRTLSALADAVSGETFDDRKAADGALLRKNSADRLGEAVVKALARMHKVLTAEQRERLAYLIRTGTVVL